MPLSRRAAGVESFKVMDVLRRAVELQDEGHAVLHCEVGQPETGAPETVAQAAVDALLEPRVMGYTDAFGLLPLREKISKHYMNYYKELQKAPPTSRIVVTTGSSGAFLLAFTACFDAGDVVAIASSGYPCYRNILSSVGCELACVKINDEFKLTAKELREEIRRRQTMSEKAIKGLILSSPSNPTGAMLSPNELEELCRLCDENDILFISDEIYHGISYGKEEATALQYSQNAIVINSFSKYYSSKLLVKKKHELLFYHEFANDVVPYPIAVSGWRLGWMIIPEVFVQGINTLQQNMFINAPTISQTAAMKCWDDDTIEILQGHVKKYAACRSLILNKLASITDIDPQNIAPADGGFYVYVDLGATNCAPGFGSVAMCAALLEEEYVAFTPGNDFEDPLSELGDRRFRISYAGGVDTVEQAMERFLRFWPNWLARVKSAGHASR
jgi:aspartate/methionine/tyrosine aminotransferase